MDKKSALIEALRCSNYANSDCKEDCPYRLLEEIKPDFPVPADVTVNGVGYWVSCDCDRMVLDAADMLESLGADHE